ncbi:MAG: DUF4347 domain-containing protein, partial [Vogesella sp.]|uniref:DUF4347 domain-containing protein n=1 Tax=Vogesella sp. TaxID=1904252 RepID=UPI003F2B31F8
MSRQPKKKPHTGRNPALWIRSLLKVPSGGRARQVGRQPSLFVEQVEPRLLLSADGLVLPPTPQQQNHEAIVVPQDLLLGQFAGSLAGQHAALRQTVNEVVFVDPAVQDYEQLLAQVVSRPDEGRAPGQLEVVVLDASRDGLEQMSGWLRQYQGIRAVHVISHGSEASLQLGSSVLDDMNLAERADTLLGWRSALASGADVLLYGCDVAKGSRGAAFVEALSRVVGADVAASDDRTGNLAQGADWLLEMATGQLQVLPLFAMSTLDYLGVLASHPVANGLPDSSLSVADGDTVDLSQVAGDLVVTASQSGLTVRYADPTRLGTLTITGGAGLHLLGGQGSNRFVIEDASRIASISAGQDAQDRVELKGLAGLSKDGSGKTVVSMGGSTFTVDKVEQFSGDISLGASAQSALGQAMDKWNAAAAQLVNLPQLQHKVPLLDKTLGELLGSALSATPGVLDNLGKVLGFDKAAAAIAAATNLGSLASALQDEINSGVAGSPFTVSALLAGDWSELRLSLQFDASRTLTVSPVLSQDISQKLAAAGFAIDALSELDAVLGLRGQVDIGLSLAGLASLDGNVSHAAFLRVAPLVVGLDLAARNVSATVGLSRQVFGSGAAAVSVNNGSIDLSCRTELRFAEGFCDEQGRLPLAKLTSEVIASGFAVNATGSLNATLPLNATLGNFNLSAYGTPTLILETDELFRVASGEKISVTSPAVSLDVSLSAELQQSILDMLGGAKELGEKLPFGLFDQEIPGVGKSLAQLLNDSNDKAAAGIGGVFNLKDAAKTYFDGFSGGSLPSIRGLVASLSATLSHAFKKAFDATQFNWSGKSLSGFDFAAFASGKGLSLDFLRGMNFSGADLRGARFDGLDLSGINFSGARLNGASFSLATLRGVNFSGAWLDGVSFAGLDLRGVNFAGASIAGVNFTGAAAFGVNWAGVRFPQLKLPNVTNLISDINLGSLFGANSGWKQLQWGLDLSALKLDWSRFDLSGIDFSGVNLSGFKLAGANLRGVTFDGANLSGVDLSGAFGWQVKWGSVLTDALTKLDNLITDINLSLGGTGSFKLWHTTTNFNGFNFSGWDLSGLDFSGKSFLGSLFRGVDFGGARLGGATFDISTDFSWADWRGIDLSGISTLLGKFRGVNFSGLNFSGISFDSLVVDLSGARFTGTSNLAGLFSGLSASVKRWFTGADFSGVDFSGLSALTTFKFAGFKRVNFSGANLSGLDFSGVDLSFASLRNVSLADL